MKCVCVHKGEWIVEGLPDTTLEMSGLSERESVVTVGPEAGC